MPAAVADFRAYRPTKDQIARAEYDRMPGRPGRRYDLNALEVRSALARWKLQKKIPQTAPLSEEERQAFEIWLTAERLERKEKSP